MPEIKSSDCAFCDDKAFDVEGEIYGGGYSFFGNGVVEQPIRVDLCPNHWHDFWRDLTRMGWVPPNDNDVSLIEWVEETA